ncbi:MAG: J domain-containing protein [Terracidiphilus sp.]
MPCVCQSCAQHAEVLGLAQEGPSKAAIRKAYKTAAKRWHPDRFENNPVQRVEAEEHFKLIQVAYRELQEHCETPQELPVEDIPVSPAAAAYSEDGNAFSRQYESGAAAETPAPVDETPAIFFGNLPGCFTAPHFSAGANRIIVASRMEPTEKPLAFVDLSHGMKHDGNPSQYILLTSYRIFVRSALNIVAFLWFTDLGTVSFIDRLTHGKPEFWQRLVEMMGLEPKYSLVIGRHNGSHFHTIAGEADDRVKKVIYNFLLKQKQQSGS